MSRDLANLSMDLRRAAYFFAQNDAVLAQKFVDRSQKYEIPENIKNLILKIKGKNNLEASEIAMTASVILAGVAATTADKGL